MISLRRYGVLIGYLTLSWVPLFLLFIAGGYQSLFGFKGFAEVIYHFSYDTSYILSLTGIVLLLTSILDERASRRSCWQSYFLHYQSFFYCFAVRNHAQNF